MFHRPSRLTRRSGVGLWQKCIARALQAMLSIVVGCLVACTSPAVDDQLDSAASDAASLDGKDGWACLPTDVTLWVQESDDPASPDFLVPAGLSHCPFAAGFVGTWEYYVQPAGNWNLPMTEQISEVTFVPIPCETTRLHVVERAIGPVEPSRLLSASAPNATWQSVKFDFYDGYCDFVLVDAVPASQSAAPSGSGYGSATMMMLNADGSVTLFNRMRGIGRLVRKK